MRQFIFIFFTVVFFVTSCNYTKFKEKPENLKQEFSLPAEKLSQLSYSLLAQKIFSPKCVSCHGSSGNVNLESYGEVVKNVALIKKSVFLEKTMPKKGVLTQEELSYLWNWLEKGAQELPEDGTPPIVIEPMLPTFDSINSNVFQVSCKDCHNETGTGKRILLDKQSLLDSPLELIIPGNADESGLVIALERTDDKRMPSAKEGYSPLSDEAKRVIRKWIDNGAKD